LRHTETAKLAHRARCDVVTEPESGKTASIAVQDRGGAMKNTLAPGIPLAIVLSAAVATVALRAGLIEPLLVTDHAQQGVL
jgi:hypothetical protein